jgi:tetratricopeptide (TPR) repeat protein
MRTIAGFLVFPLFFLIAVVAAAQQEPYSDDPVIIRDTDIAEGVEHKEPPKELDPAEAKKNVEVGNFYSKQGNYVGAIGRYLTALEYQPELSRAYEAFERAFASLLKSLDDEPDRSGRIGRNVEDTKPDRSEKIAQAVSLMESYILSNPDPVRREEIQKKIEKLREQAASPTK